MPTNDQNNAVKRMTELHEAELQAPYWIPVDNGIEHHDVGFFESTNHSFIVKLGASGTAEVYRRMVKNLNLE